MTAINQATHSAIAGGTSDQDKLRRVYRKITLHLVPFLFICYLFNYFDRVNVGFAKLQMLGDLHLSETVYGLGAGIFFVGYVACAVPSNLALYRIGARRWLSVTMILCGIFSAGLMFVNSALSFYVLRLLNGAAEAAFFPGIILYFTQWFPSAERGGVTALFMSAVPISGLLGSPFSGWILNTFSNGLVGLSGWQWLYLIEGLPIIPLGIILFFILSDDVDEANWLSIEERVVLKAALKEDDENRPAEVSDTFTQVLRNPAVWLLGIVYFCVECGVYAINFWLPTIIRSSGISNPMTIGWLSAIPYLAASIFMIFVGRSADAQRERRWHLAGPMLMGVAGLAIAANFASNPAIAMIGLTLASMGALTGLPTFWPLSSGYLTAAAAAGGVGLIQSLGQFAGLLSPYLVGWVQDTTHSTDLALYILAFVMLVGTALVLRIPARIVNR